MTAIRPHEHTPTLADSESRLARQGHRLTEPRRAVLETLAGSDGPLTIEEVCDQTPRVGRATVFRTMKLLQELDVICRVPLEDGTARYVLSTAQHHHHLVCRRCGSVTEFGSPALDRELEAQADRAGFELDAHAVELYGTCARCHAPA
jgi:Fur family ferric uptake transcriptional regulator